MAQDKPAWLTSLHKKSGKIWQPSNDWVARFGTPGVDYLFGKKQGMRGGQALLLYGPPKCIKHDAIIVDPDTGRRMTLKEAFESKLSKVYSLNEETNKIEVRKVSDWIDSGVKPIMKTTTSLGTTIESTPDHMFLTMSGWKKMEDIEIDDKIAVPRSVSCGTLTMSPNKLFILGSLIADGGLTHGVSWTKKDPELQMYLDGDIAYVSVISKEMTEPSQCYDITVPGTHNFIANDIVVHNSGKSLLALSMIGAMHKQDDEGVVLYFDTEYRESFRHWSVPMGIDENRFIPFITNNPIDIFDFIANDVNAMIQQQGAKIRAIVIDSLAGINYPKESNKSQSTDMVIGDAAAYLPGALKLILPVIKQHKIALVVCQHVRANMDPMKAKYHPYIIPGGNALKHAIEYWMLCEKINSKDAREFTDDLKDGSGNAIQSGHSIRVKMQESSDGPHNRSVEVFLDYRQGIANQHEEVARLGIHYGIIERPNNVTYVYGDQKWRGRQEFEEYLKTDDTMQREIMNKISEKDLT